MDLSIIIPAYNEEKRISSTINNFHNFYSKKLKENFEIIIVTNNCSDRTYEICERFSKNKKQIKLININKNCGKGGAIIEGFKISKGEKAGFVDADGSIDAYNFFKLYKNLNDSEGIIASKRLKDSKITNESLFGKFQSFIFNLIVRIFFNLKYKDTQCGAKIFNRKEIKMILEDISEKGWIFDVNLLYICKKKEIQIKELPVACNIKKGTKLTFYDKINSIKNLLIYRLKCSKI